MVATEKEVQFSCVSALSIKVIELQKTFVQKLLGYTSNGHFLGQLELLQSSSRYEITDY